MIRRTLAGVLLACLALTGAKCSAGMHRGQPVKPMVYWDEQYPLAEWDMMPLPKNVAPLEGWNRVGWTRRPGGRVYGVWVKHI